MAAVAGSAPLLFQSSSSSSRCRPVVLAVHDIHNGGGGTELMEPTYEVASVGRARASPYPEDFPLKNVVNFTIVVNKASQWRSTSVSSSGRPLGGGAVGGLMDDSTERRSFRISFYEFLFSNSTPDQGLARIRRQVGLTDVVRPEYCDLVAEALFTTASEYIKGGMVNNTHDKLRSFAVKVEIQVVRTIEYRQIENRGRKRKGLLD